MLDDIKEGQVLIATIANGKTFTWNAGAATPLQTRASTATSGFSTANNPTATRLTLVSPTTRHLCHFGTETTIGTTTTQDDMFIRFSDQEDINDYTATAINSASFIEFLFYLEKCLNKIFMRNKELI